MSLAALSSASDDYLAWTVLSVTLLVGLPLFVFDFFDVVELGGWARISDLVVNRLSFDVLTG